MIRRIRPDLVIGFGGSMTIPSIFASKILGYPSIVHEQMLSWGGLIKFFVKYVDQIATAYPKVLGIPPRYNAKNRINWQSSSLCDHSRRSKKRNKFKPNSDPRRQPRGPNIQQNHPGGRQALTKQYKRKTRNLPAVPRRRH